MVSRDERSTRTDVSSIDRKPVKINDTRWPTEVQSTTQIAAAKGQPPQPKVEGLVNRRACYSLDEKVLFDLHHHQQSSTASQQPSSFLQAAAAWPNEPPFAPPKRTRTPDGVPSWPGPAQRRASQPELPRNVIQRSHKRIGQFVAKALSRNQNHHNGKRARICRKLGVRLPIAEAPPAAQWRPPMSGHTTFRFGALETHPFNRATLSTPVVGATAVLRAPGNRISSTRNLSSTQTSPGGRPIHPGIQLLGSPEEEETPLLGDHDRNRQERSARSSESVVISTSARALAALSELPLPVSTARVEAQTARRSSSIPRSRLQSPVHGAGSQRRATYPSSTIRTRDLIEAFPDPPSRSALRPISSPHARMSLFPALAHLNERSGNTSRLVTDASHIFTPETADEYAEREELVSSSPKRNELSEGEFSLLSLESLARCSGALPNPSTSDGTMVSPWVDGPSTLGEERERYRPPGESSAVLGVVDNRNEGESIDASLRHSVSPASGKTGATRYFSAASQVAPTARKSSQTVPLPATPSPETQEAVEGQTQQERAVANGALRFVSQRYSFATTMEPNQTGNGEANVPEHPTSHVTPCLHRTGGPRRRKSFIRSKGDVSRESSFGGADRSCVKCRSKVAMQRMVQAVKRRKFHTHRHPHMCDPF
ncbi:hypothetical protein Q7P37_007914 [Cladosporium fusiforme]